jgi:hypothetical protein
MYCATYILCNSGAQKFSRNIISGAAVPNSAVWAQSSQAQLDNPDNKANNSLTKPIKENK